MVITHNMMAANGNRQLAIVNGTKSISAERLSSGYRINRAADDAAGLTISEKMRWQKRGLDRASINAQEGVSYIQVAEGALNEMQAIMNRCSELCVQAANDTNTQSDRAAIQEEINQLTEEIDRIASTTMYNERNVFETGAKSPFALMESTAEALNEISVTYSYIDKDGAVQTITTSTTGTATNYTGDMATIAAYVAEQAGKAASVIAAAYPSLVAGSSSNIQIGLNLANIDGSGNTLASAALSMSWSSGTTNMKYTLNVDTSDYNISNYNDGSLAETIAHEMMHFVMEDVLTAGMLGQNSEPLPQWFVEGTAQTASGDNGWVTNRLNTSSTDADIKNYLGNVSSQPYGAGYLATLYLGQLASGSAAGSVSTSSIRSGLNTVFGKLVEGYTLSQIINEVSGGKYTTYQAFANELKNDADALTFTKAFLAAKGDSGEGSIVANNLTGSVVTTMSGQSAYGSYKVITTAKDVTNTYSTGFTFPDKGNRQGSGGGGAGSGGVNAQGDLFLQVGALAGVSISLITFDASANALLRGKGLDVMSHTNASSSITTVNEASEGISKIRSYYGAMQNRLEHTIANLDNTGENTQAAESKIRDTDMAEEMMNYSVANILSQAGQSMLAQAKQATSGVLQLING